MTQTATALAKTMTASKEEAEEGLRLRREKYPQYVKDFAAAEEKWKDHLHELRANGYTVMRNFATPQQVSRITAAFDEHCRTGASLQSARDLRNIADPEDWLQNNRFTKADMAKGQDWLGDKTNFLQADDPLRLYPDLAYLSLDERILDIGGAYLGALPLMSFAKIRKSFANTVPLFDTEFFHIDGNSPNMMKGLLLLSDMEPEAARMIS